MRKLFGIPASQASRCMWALEELGLDYDLEIVRPYTDTKTPEFLALNPNRKIPVLVDDEVILWESLAINAYLATRYGSPLWPKNQAEQAKALQWSFWVTTEVEPYLWEMWQRRASAQPDEARASAAENQLRQALEILDAHLAQRAWVTGEAFSVADLNLESYIIRARRGGYDLTAHPHLLSWIDRCEDRPARQKVRAKITAYENEQAR